MGDKILFQLLSRRSTDGHTRLFVYANIIDTLSVRKLEQILRVNKLLEVVPKLCVKCSEMWANPSLISLKNVPGAITAI